MRLEWHGSPHRLYMIARSAEGLELEIAGDGVETFEADFLSERYTSVKTLPGQNFLEAPAHVEFTLSIADFDGTVFESIEFTYSTIECTCAVYDAI